MPQKIWPRPPPKHLKTITLFDLFHTININNKFNHICRWIVLPFQRIHGQMAIMIVIIRVINGRKFHFNKTFFEMTVLCSEHMFFPLLKRFAKSHVAQIILSWLHSPNVSRQKKFIHNIFAIYDKSQLEVGANMKKACILNRKLVSCYWEYQVHQRDDLNKKAKKVMTSETEKQIPATWKIWKISF